MQHRAWCLTDKGLKRDSNQDSFLINEDLGLYVVADGMGGHSGGEVASNLAVEVAEEILLQPENKNKSPKELIALSFEEASRRIFDMAANERKELVGMGTTMVMAIVKANQIYIGNVGDSRCYLFNKPHLWQITEDHSLLNEQLRSGVMSEEQARATVAKNIITRSVGYEREVHPDIIEREVLPGECFILCSDGLSGLVNDQKISELLNATPAESTAKACIDQALTNGGDDNVTVMVLQFYE